MGLIKNILQKTLGAGLIVAGLPLGAVGLAVSVPVKNKMEDLQAEIMDKNNQSKLVCALNDKLSHELEQLNATTFELGDYVVSTEPEDRQKKYEQIYDKVVSSFGKLETVSLITKEEFVNYMMTNGEELENYVNSEEFYSRLMELKNILQDKTKTPEEKMHTLKEAINYDETIFDSQYLKYDRIEMAAEVFMVLQLMSGIAQAVMAMSMFDGLDKDDDAIEWIAALTGVLIGPCFACGCCRIAVED